VDPDDLANQYEIIDTDKVQALLSKMNTAFDCNCTIDAAGKIKMTDNNAGESGLAVTVFKFSDGVNPFGISDGITNTFNVTTSKQQVVSTAQALNSSGAVITADTPLTGVYNSALAQFWDGSAPIPTVTFNGVSSDGVDTPALGAVFTAGEHYGPPLENPTGTMRDLLTWLENQFNADASIDGAGRLVLTDRKAGEIGGYTSKLEITSIAYSGAVKPFGEDLFTTIAADTNEDGSRAGDLTSLAFSTEALSTTQYANGSTTIFQDQDGFAAGFLQSVSVDTSGIITGNYSNGQVLEKAQVALASFNNQAGLRKEGGNVFRQTTGSGAPITGAPGANGLGSISPNSLEQSNVDLGAEFVKLITTQRGFQANSKIITTTDEMLQDLINIKR
jgi:flagellar hook protein FlgE